MKLVNLFTLLLLITVAGFAQTGEVTAPEEFQWEVFLVGLLGALFLLSEVLGSIPSVKANAVYQFIYGLLKKLVALFPSKKK
jgi:uncharacterized membrane protein YdcZ (DUF606 family)